MVDGWWYLNIEHSLALFVNIQLGKLHCIATVSMCRWRKFSVFSGFFTRLFSLNFPIWKPRESNDVIAFVKLDIGYGDVEKLRYIVKASSFTRNIQTQISRTAQSCSYSISLRIRIYNISKWKTSFGPKNFFPFLCELPIIELLCHFIHQVAPHLCVIRTSFQSSIRAATKPPI